MSQNPWVPPRVPRGSVTENSAEPKGFFSAQSFRFLEIQDSGDMSIHRLSIQLYMMCFQQISEKEKMKHNPEGSAGISTEPPRVLTWNA